MVPPVQAIEAAGGEFMYSVGGEKIIMEDGAVCGLQNRQGSRCAGTERRRAHGRLGGEDMQMQVFNTPVFSLGNSPSDGAGISMVLDAGGALDRNSAILGNECGALRLRQRVARSRKTGTT